jgi:hypothetical protein
LRLIFNAGRINDLVPDGKDEHVGKLIKAASNNSDGVAFRN